ncbi:hypothetical protein, unlikely [Trypanosoma congolense IL3000]|uniref:Uncharacterized protein n=1 Tax=Trypanosoma congolense (strain IL3000) TaxID=1068625 RepID=F9WEL7_TRYCI|nr:hypothetical protein, unlikely [Trypanosoma congolense IL3000]
MCAMLYGNTFPICCGNLDCLPLHSSNILGPHRLGRSGTGIHGKFTMIMTTCLWKPSTRRSGVGVGGHHHPHTNPARVSLWSKRRRLSYKCRIPPWGTSLIYLLPPDHGLGYRICQFYSNHPVVFEKTFIAQNAFILIFFWEGRRNKI